MSGLGRVRGGGHGRNGGSGGIAALRRGMPPKKSQLMGKAAAPSPAARGVDASSNALEESFQLVSAAPGASQFAMVMRLTPGLLDELRRVETEGGTNSMKFGAYPTGHLIKVGQEEFKFSSAPEQGELCDICEERRGGEDGQGMLAAVGSAWRKIAVQRTLSASEKDRVKKRSVEAEQQLKSRKAIVLDSLMKTDSTSSLEGNGRRPPLKSRKEPPPKKRKVAQTVVPVKAKPPSAAPLPPKEKSGPPVSAEPAAPPPPSPACTSAAAPHLQPPPSSNTVPLERRSVVEEITVGSSPQTKSIQKDKAANVVTTPEVPNKTSGAVNMTDLRNSLIFLLTENPRGMTIKAVEKALGEVMPNAQPGRKNIEKVIKSIASYHAPGKYLLKPGIKPESFTKPSLGGGSLLDTTAAESPGSPVGATESKGDTNQSLKESLLDKESVLSAEVERIDIIEEQSPLKSPANEHEKNFLEREREEDAVQVASVNDTTRSEGALTEAPDTLKVDVPKAASSGSSSSSGSDSDSDSESDSSSGSESGSGSGSGSGSASDTDGSSSSSDEDEDVDIVSDDENHIRSEKQKPKSEKKTHKNDKLKVSKPELEKQNFEEFHKDASRSSEDIDIGDADDNCKLDAIVERITETIPMEVETISCEGVDSPQTTQVKSNSAETTSTREEIHQRHERDKAGTKLQPRENTHLLLNSEELECRGRVKHATQDTSVTSMRDLHTEKTLLPKAIPDLVEAEPKHNTAMKSREPRLVQKSSEKAREDLELQSATIRNHELATSKTSGQSLNSTDKHKVHTGLRPTKKNEAIGDQLSMDINSEPSAHDLNVHQRKGKSASGRAGKGSVRSGQKDSGKRSKDLKRDNEVQRDSDSGGKLDADKGLSKTAFDNDSRGGSELELGEFRETTPEQNLRSLPHDEVSKPHQASSEADKIKGTARKPSPISVDGKKSEGGMGRRPAEEPLQNPRPSKRAAPSSHQHETPVNKEKVVLEKNLRMQGKDRRGSPGMANNLYGSVPAENPQSKADVDLANRNPGLKKAGVLSSAEAKSKDNSSGDSIQSKGTEFFAPYEKEAAELRGPIKTYEQYLEYCHEYREKYAVYIQLNTCLEFDRESFESLQRDIELAKRSNDKTRLANVYQKVRQDYLHCRKRFKRMSRTFILLHHELRTIKDRCKEYTC